VLYTCSASLKIRAQEMTAAQLASTCSSLANQDAYFYNLVANRVPVAADYNTTLEVNVFNSATDYQTYAGSIFGISTNNGGMYLEGDPAAYGNVPRFIAYEAEWLRPEFAIWNLNHEYTHSLDGRYDMYGDFTAGTTTPTIWWVEGFAEYVSYSYRNVVYAKAITAAGQGTYQLSTLFDTTYENANSTRIYSWGYLAVRYMLEKHRSDVLTLLKYYRAGSWSAARTLLKTTIGTRYDADFRAWLSTLSACGSGTCPPANQAPTAAFTTVTNGLTITATDQSTDPDGGIASRSWNFGDSTTSTSTSPTHTYSTAGSYTITLTVTDTAGATSSTSKTLTVGGGGGLPECSESDTRELGKNCQRSNLSAPTRDYAYLTIYLPAGVSTLTFSTSGGTGDADLYYNPYDWATTTAYTQRSVTTGNNETVRVNNPTAGYRYISLYAATGFSNVTVRSTY
jgi:microbial collagenase